MGVDLILMTAELIVADGMTEKHTDMEFVQVLKVKESILVRGTTDSKLVVFTNGHQVLLMRASGRTGRDMELESNIEENGFIRESGLKGIKEDMV
jgi:hypothetical protein